MMRRGGPSPRARGSRRHVDPHLLRVRSIPAGAGKPRQLARLDGLHGVHPRGRGEACTDGTSMRYDSGPSPRARGSPASPLALGAQRRSIPAGAGKPCSSTRRPSLSTVHPRGRGEARVAPGRALSSPGPSPRARGSRVGHGGGRARFGSIPAGAGKPPNRSRGIRPGRVHPRGRGEALLRMIARERATGPSPRARGSPVAGRNHLRRLGSIPAGAGKPVLAMVSVGVHTVHPRGRGEAFLDQLRVRRSRGPSPRARGSPNRDEAGSRFCGSIPAGAGKPSPEPPTPPPSRVHPRGRGEASVKLLTGS